jgi:hypothetical protein
MSDSVSKGFAVGLEPHPFNLKHVEIWHNTFDFLASVAQEVMVKEGREGEGRQGRRGEGGG